MEQNPKRATPVATRTRTDRIESAGSIRDVLADLTSHRWDPETPPLGTTRNPHDAPITVDVAEAVDTYERIVRSNRTPLWDTVLAVGTDDTGEAFSELIDLTTAAVTRRTGDPDEAYDIVIKAEDALYEAFDAMQARFRAELLATEFCQECGCSAASPTHSCARGDECKTCSK